MADTKIVLVTNVSGSELRFVGQHIKNVSQGEQTTVVVQKNGVVHPIAATYVFIKTREEIDLALARAIQAIYPIAEISCVIKKGGVMPHLQHRESLPPNVHVYQFLKREGTTRFLERHVKPVT